MIFLSNKVEAKAYTHIHNDFFEQILPFIEAKYLKIYIYAYYLAFNVEKLGAKNAHDIASALQMEYTDVISAFDYLENCNLIRKHYTQNSSSDNYSIEFLKFDLYNKNPVKSYEEEYVIEKNENLIRMYEKIEEITKIHLSAYDIKKIDTIIKNNDLAYDVIVEAFKFTYYNKKISSVNEVIKTIKAWIAEGIVSTSDLDNNLFNINERYAVYRKILKYFGEYRLPTKPEMKKMDKWIDEYNFSIEVIEKAIDETLKIKSPNFKYLDAILDKWYEYYNVFKMSIDIQKGDYNNFRKNLLNDINMESIELSQDKLLLFLFKNFPYDTIYSAIGYLQTNNNNKKIKIEDLFEFITGNEDVQSEKMITFGAITLNDIEEILKRNEKSKVKNMKEKNSFNVKSTKNTKLSQTSQPTDKEIEDIILSKNDLNDF